MIPQVDITFIVLLVLAGFCYLTNNHTVTFAVLILLLFKVTPLAKFFPDLQQYGITIGIVILTAAVLVPLANGSLTIQEIVKSFTTWQSVLTILIGIFVSWLGMRGIGLMESKPVIVNGLIIGTLIGVSVFKGVPVGPLIAAGLLSLLIGKA